jgi:outer membrane protein assembly factor BamE
MNPSIASPNRPPLPALLLATALSIALVAGCSTDDTTRSGLFEPYRIDLPQGNYITRDMLDRVQVGAPQAEVRQILGTPLLTGVFVAGRWNYVFRYRHPNGRVELRRVMIHFNDKDRVTLIEHDPLPDTENPSDPALPGFRANAYNRT